REAIDMTAKAYSVAAELDPTRSVEVAEGMRASGDRNLVRTVLQNLIGNAFKFSPVDSVVTVGQTDDVFWVRDRGIGFDMAYAPKIFLPFERLVTEGEFEGTGIGLANVERIVKRHNGRVWAESEPGHGATFYFTLG
ncbi:histidine kinase, partial [bacterium]